jgi:peptidoglycan biosynthesis protein MviN/MurJ (putative lipid II flippase)
VTSTSQRLLRVLVGSFLMNALAKLAGLPRVYGISRAIGDSAAADVYFQGWLVLTTLEGVLYFGAIYMAVMPEASQADDPRTRSGVLAGAAVVLGGVTAVFLAALALAGPTLVAWVSPGFSDELQRVNLRFLWHLWPSIVAQPLLGLIAILAATESRFTLVNAVQLSKNLLFLVALFVVVDPTLDGMALALNVSNVGSVLAMMTLAWPLRRRVWPTGTLAAASRVARRALPVVVVLSLGELYGNVDRVLATTVSTGFVSQLAYARTILSFTVAIAYSTVQIVYYNAFAAADDVASSLQQSIRALAFIIVPVVVLVVVLRADAVSLALSGRSVSAEGQQMIQVLIVVLAGVIMIDAGSGMVSSALIARGASGAAALVQGLALATLLVTFRAAAPLGASTALVLALCVASGVRASASWVAARRTLGPPSASAPTGLGVVLGCGVASGLAGVVVQTLLPQAWWATGVVGGAGVFVYAMLALVLRVPEATVLMRTIRRRLGARGAVERME